MADEVIFETLGLGRDSCKLPILRHSILLPVAHPASLHFISAVYARKKSKLEPIGFDIGHISPCLPLHQVFIPLIFS